MDMYSRVKRRKSLRRNTFAMQTHHKVISKSEAPEEEGREEEETDGMLAFDLYFLNAIILFLLFLYISNTSNLH